MPPLRLPAPPHSLVLFLADPPCWPRLALACRAGWRLCAFSVPADRRRWLQDQRDGAQRALGWGGRGGRGDPEGGKGEGHGNKQHAMSTPSRGSKCNTKQCRATISKMRHCEIEFHLLHKEFPKPGKSWVSTNERKVSSVTFEQAQRQRPISASPFTPFSAGRPGRPLRCVTVTPLARVVRAHCGLLKSTNKADKRSTAARKRTEGSGEAERGEPHRRKDLSTRASPLQPDQLQILKLYFN